MVLMDETRLQKLCSAELFAGCEDYFVPIIRDDGIAPCGENIYYDSPRRGSGIMVRRYALTSVGSKYLEIGINVGLMADVEILLGDNHGNHLILPWHTWNVLFDSRETIEECARLSESDSMRIDDLMV